MNWSNPMKPLKRPIGRPSLFTTELGDEICNRIADGESLRAICDEADMPDKATVFRWLLAEQHVFLQSIQNARAIFRLTFYSTKSSGQASVVFVLPPSSASRARARVLVAKVQPFSSAIGLR